MTKPKKFIIRLKTFLNFVIQFLYRYYRYSYKKQNIKIIYLKKYNLKIKNYLVYKNINSIKSFFILTYLDLKKKIILSIFILKCLKFLIRYLRYFKIYHERFFIVIFLKNILNYQFYRAYNIDLGRGINRIIRFYINKQLINLSLFILFSTWRHNKKRIKNFFFLFLKNLRFKIFFIFFYFFLFFNILIFRNFLIETPFDATIPRDKKEYQKRNKTRFFPLTFIESVSFLVRPFHKYINTFNLIRINIYVLHLLLFHYVFSDIFVFLKKIIKYVVFIFLNIFNFFRRRFSNYSSLFYYVLFFDRFIWTIMLFNKKLYSIFSSIYLFFNFYIGKLGFATINIVVTSKINEYQHLKVKSNYNFLLINFFKIVKLINNFFFKIFIFICFGFFIFICFGFFKFFNLFFIFKLFLIIYFMYIYFFYYNFFYFLLKIIIKLLLIFQINSQLFNFSLSLYYLFLSELKVKYYFSTYFYDFFIKKMQLNQKKNEKKMQLILMQLDEFFKINKFLNVSNLSIKRYETLEFSYLIDYIFIFDLVYLTIFLVKNKISFIIYKKCYKMLYTSYVNYCNKMNQECTFNFIELNENVFKKDDNLSLSFIFIENFNYMYFLFFVVYIIIYDSKFNLLWKLNPILKKIKENSENKNA